MKNRKSVTIGKTRLPRQVVSNEYVPAKANIVGYEEILSQLAYAVKKNLPALMIGETGVGKTSLIRYLAKQTNSGFRRLNLNGQTTIDEFVGKVLLDQKGTYWVDGVLIDAMRKGHWLLLDEINAALPEILFVLHSLLDDDKYVVLSEHSGEVVRPHKNFRLFASMNPSGKYAGTKDLNKAFLSRFPMILQLDFPEANEEFQILRLYSKKADDNTLRSLIKMAGDLRTSYKKDDIEFICSTRDLINCALMSEDRGLQEALQLSILNRCQSEDEKAVRAVIKLYFGTDMAVASIIPDWQKEYIQLNQAVSRSLSEIGTQAAKADMMVKKIIESKKSAMSDKEELDFVFEDVLPRTSDSIGLVKSTIDSNLEELKKRKIS